MPGRTCVIVNPASGRGRGARRLEELRARLGPSIELQSTQAPGHAEQLAYEATQAGFAVVAAAGGDGTIHEAANGVLRAGRPDVIFHVLPVGSANDYAYTLEQENGDGEARPPRRVDVGLVRGGDGRQRYFINGMGLGFNTAVTLEARRIRWLRGLPLYVLALLRTITARFECPELTIAFDDLKRKVPTLALTLGLGRREGGFLLTPHARLADGMLDYLHAGALRRWELLTYLPRMVLGRIPADDVKVWTGRCQRVSVQSEKALSVHLDGELFCLPEDNVHGLEVIVQPAALNVSWGWEEIANCGVRMAD
jgi:diacylglycerol kinase family enzyme